MGDLNPFKPPKQQAPVYNSGPSEAEALALADKKKEEDRIAERKTQMARNMRGRRSLLGSQNTGQGYLT